MTGRFAPDFRLALGGEPIPAALRASVSSVSLTSALEGADRVELSVANQALRWTDHPLFRAGTPLTLHLGYQPDGLEQVFVGEVVSTQASFPSGGQPTLTVAAHDRTEHLREHKRTAWYAVPVPTVGQFPLPDLAIAPLVSIENGFLPVVDPVGAALSVILYGATVAVAVGDTHEMQKLIRRQQGESDLEFLTKLSRENGWEMLVDHTGETGGHVLRFMSPMDELEPVRRFHYGSSLVEWSPRITSVGVVASVTAYLRMSALKTVFEVTVGYDWDDAALEVSIMPTVFARPPRRTRAGKREPERSLVLGDNLSVLSAPRRILGELLPSLNRRVTGSGTVVGDPALMAGRVVQLEGLGTQFGGRYRITTATHTLGSGGYTTGFEARKEIWFGSIPALDQGAVELHVPFADLRAGVRA